MLPGVDLLYNLERNRAVIPFKPERSMDQRQEEAEKQQGSVKRPEPLRVRLPGFLIEGEVGLGDVIKRATHAIGIEACGGCERRAALLNRWVAFHR